MSAPGSVVVAAESIETRGTLTIEQAVISVLRGEMSLVGPRPVVREELDYYASSARHYLSARPGLSGLWQISGRSNTTYMERVQMDRFYVMKWNPWMDLRIIFMTIPAVVMSRGAH